jgi:2-methylisocitrate lyase-like PEP mutase family enzyme
MTNQSEKAARFLDLHRPGNPLLLPNPWDQGSARLLASLGFQALATTSSGYAATLGRLDGSVNRDEALAHAAAVVAATELPVSADLENCYADDPAGVARTVALAVEAGLAGCSLEDFTGGESGPIYDIGPATERVAAAAEAAHAGPVRLVLTARAENYLHGRPDLADTIARLQAYQAAGADVLYAPGLTSLADIRQVITAVDRPVNVLAVAGAPSVGELAEAGVSRVSVGGAFAFAALGALVDAATELRDQGTYGYLAGTAAGRRAIQDAVLAGCHTASASRPGAILCSGSNSSLTARRSASDGTGPCVSVRSLTSSGAYTTTARGATAAVPAWPSPPSPARSAATNLATAAAGDSARTFTSRTPAPADPPIAASTPLPASAALITVSARASSAGGNETRTSVPVSAGGSSSSARIRSRRASIFSATAGGSPP